MTNLGRLTSAIALLIILLDHFSKTHQRCAVSYRGNSKPLPLFSFCFRCNFVISIIETGGNRPAEEQNLYVIEVKLE